MRILITGGAGFIGSHIAEAALAGGHEVCVLDDLSTGRQENVPAGARFMRGDVRDEATLARVFAEFRPEAVSHQAAQTSVAVSAREPVRDADVNVIGSIRVLEVCVQHRVGHLVFASTGGAIYGEVPEGQRARVEWPARPLSPYGSSKLAVEHYLAFYRHEHGLRSTVLRYANVYGPRQDPHGEAGVVAIFCQRLLAGTAIQVNACAEPGDAGCVRDYVYVADVVAANLAALEGRLHADLWNVASGRETTTLALAQCLAALTDSQSAIGFGPRRAGDLRRSVLEPGAGRPVSELPGHTLPLEEGLARTVQWFRDR